MTCTALFYESRSPLLCSKCSYSALDMAFSIGLNCLAAVQIARQVGAPQKEGGKALMRHFAPLIDQDGTF